jgi:hypothetical protein
MTRQAYVFQGIDLQVSLNQASKHSKEGSDVIVHYHSKGSGCQDFKHVRFTNGNKTEEWGEVDGSSHTPVRQRQ